MANNYKYSEEYRERFGFNGSDMYWMEQAFDLFSKKASEEVRESLLNGNSIIFSEDYFPSMFKDVLSKAKQWSTPPKSILQDE